MAAIRVADLFASVGMRVDVRQLNMFQKRLAGVKKQLLQLKRLSRTPLSPNTNIAAVRSLNSELARTLRISRQIQNQGPIRVRRTGGAGGRGGGGRRGGAGQNFFGGAAAGTLGLRGGLQRNFLQGFTAIVAVRQVFRATASLQGIEVALGAVTREGQTTGEVMGFLRGEAKRLGFDFQTSALEYAKLAAAGNSVNLNLQTVNEVFIAAQEAARVFNLSVSDTEGVLKAFTQIISKGKITAEELRNQLGDRLPGAVGIFAKALGVSTQELSIMLEKGQVLADDKTLLAVAKELRRTVASQVEAASRNLTASLNRFRTTLFDFSAALGRAGIGDIFAKGLQGATVILKILGPLLKGFIRILRLLLAPFFALGRIITRFTDRLPKTTAAILGIAAAMFLLRNATLAASLAWIKLVAPFVAAGLAVAAIILLIDDLATFLEGGESLIGKMGESTNIFLRKIAQGIQTFGLFVRFMAELVAAIATGNFDFLTESLDRFIQKLRDFVGLTAASGLVTDLLEATFGFNTGEVDSNFGRIPDFVPGQNAGGDTNVNVALELDGAIIAEVAITANEGERRQAQADFPNNE